MKIQYHDLLKDNHSSRLDWFPNDWETNDSVLKQYIFHSMCCDDNFLKFFKSYPDEYWKSNPELEIHLVVNGHKMEPEIMVQFMKSAKEILLDLAKTIVKEKVNNEVNEFVDMLTHMKKQLKEISFYKDQTNED